MSSSKPSGSNIFWLRFREVVLLAIWFGLFTGLIESGVLATRKLVLGKMVFMSPDAFWMAPFFYVTLFGTLGATLWVILRQWDRIRWPQLPILFFAFLSFGSVLFIYYPKLSKLTILLLATGLALQTSRFVARRTDGFQRLIARTLPVGVLLATAPAGLQIWGAVVEQKRIKELPQAGTSAPNVILIVMDTVRARSLSLYGANRPTTPHLERIAKQGVKFNLAISTAPWTLPSHVGMFTGRWAHEVSADWYVPLDTTFPTLAEKLSQQGYVTGGFSANVRYCGYETGLNRGFIHWEDYPLSLSEITISSSLGRFITNSPRLRRTLDYHDMLGRKDAAELRTNFLDWVSDQKGRPFFAFLNFFDSHEPYMPPAPYDSMYGHYPNRGPFMYEGNQAFRVDKWEMSPKDVEAEKAMYEAAITYLDSELGKLFNELERRQLINNTIVIITADHGEQLGEHGLFGHLNSLYLPLIHVPLLIVSPSLVPTDFQVHDAVSLRDIPATVMELLGKQQQSVFPGSSLSRFWRAAPVKQKDPILSELNPGYVERDWYPVASGGMKSLISENYHYVKLGNGAEELYDFVNDPSELTNLAGLPKYKHVVESFRESLTSLTSKVTR